MADAIYDQIEIEDMTFDPALQIYHYPCPCGDRFEISIDDLRDGENVAVCPSCSLMIEVIFEPVCISLSEGGGGKALTRAGRRIYRGQLSRRRWRWRRRQQLLSRLEDFNLILPPDRTPELHTGRLGRSLWRVCMEFWELFFYYCRVVGGFAGCRQMLSD